MSVQSTIENLLEERLPDNTNNFNDQFIDASIQEIVTPQAGD